MSGTPITHAPAGYDCPFCRFVAGETTGAPVRTDIVAETDGAVAFISPRWWPRNPGHVIVIPREHSENLYSIAGPQLSAVMELVQETAIALRSEGGCTGTSIRQHNEPDGGQDVWHFHIHVFPRFAGDDLYASEPLDGWVDAAERATHARRLRNRLRADPLPDTLDS